MTPVRGAGSAHLVPSACQIQLDEAWSPDSAQRVTIG